MAIVNWEYYSSLYSKVSEDDFSTAEILAENEVRDVIGTIRWETINEETFGYNVLKDCICRVINQMADNKVVAGRIGISSVSNDGYTENYSGSTTTIGMNRDLKNSIRQMLSGTGLIGAY